MRAWSQWNRFGGRNSYFFRCSGCIRERCTIVKIIIFSFTRSTMQFSLDFDIYNIPLLARTSGVLLPIGPLLARLSNSKWKKCPRVRYGFFSTFIVYFRLQQKLAVMALRHRLGVNSATEGRKGLWRTLVGIFQCLTWISVSEKFVRRKSWYLSCLRVFIYISIILT